MNNTTTTTSDALLCRMTRQILDRQFSAAAETWALHQNGIINGEPRASASSWRTLLATLDHRGIVRALGEEESTALAWSALAVLSR